MIKLKPLLPILLLGCVAWGQAQENEDYIEFNDRKNVVHGVYLGLTTYFGEIDNKDTYLGGIKVAYVANRQFEVGFVGVFLYSEQDNPRTLNEDLIGGYGGLHLEPILFSKSLVNLSFPVLIGAGGVGYLGNDFDDRIGDIDRDDIDAVFVVEPGMSASIQYFKVPTIGGRHKISLFKQIGIGCQPAQKYQWFFWRNWNQSRSFQHGKK